MKLNLGAIGTCGVLALSGCSENRAREASPPAVPRDDGCVAGDCSFAITNPPRDGAGDRVAEYTRGVGWYGTPNESYFCTASLVCKNQDKGVSVVITAHHCVEDEFGDFTGADPVFSPGLFPFWIPDRPEPAVMPSEIWSVPRNSNLPEIQDIALAKLPTYVDDLVWKLNYDFSGNNATPLPYAEDLFDVVGNWFEVAGYGITTWDDADSTGVPSRVSLQAANDPRHTDPRWVIATKPNGSDPSTWRTLAPGDSGSPLYRADPSNTNRVIYGIASQVVMGRTIPDSGNFGYGVFSDVRSLLAVGREPKAADRLGGAVDRLCEVGGLRLSVQRGFSSASIRLSAMPEADMSRYDCEIEETAYLAGNVQEFTRKVKVPLGVLQDTPDGARYLYELLPSTSASDGIEIRPDHESARLTARCQRGDYVITSNTLMLDALLREIDDPASPPAPPPPPGDPTPPPPGDPIPPPPGDPIPPPPGDPIPPPPGDPIPPPPGDPIPPPPGDPIPPPPADPTPPPPGDPIPPPPEGPTQPYPVDVKIELPSAGKLHPNISWPVTTIIAFSDGTERVVSAFDPSYSVTFAYDPSWLTLTGDQVQIASSDRIYEFAGQGTFTTPLSATLTSALGQPASISRTIDVSLALPAVEHLTLSPPTLQVDLASYGGSSWPLTLAVGFDDGTSRIMGPGSSMPGVWTTQCQGAFLGVTDLMLTAGPLPPELTSPQQTTVACELIYPNGMSAGTSNAVPVTVIPPQAPMLPPPFPTPVDLYVTLPTGNTLSLAQPSLPMSYVVAFSDGSVQAVGPGDPDFSFTSTYDASLVTVAGSQLQLFPSETLYEPSGSDQLTTSVAVTLTSAHGQAASLTRSVDVTIARPRPTQLALSPAVVEVFATPAGIGPVSPFSVMARFDDGSERELAGTTAPGSMPWPVTCTTDSPLLNVSGTMVMPGVLPPQASFLTPVAVTVTCALTSGNGSVLETNAATVTIRPEFPPPQLQIIAGPSFLSVGQSAALSVQLSYSDGSQAEAGDSIMWDVTDPGVAQVTSVGGAATVVGLGTGSASLVARIQLGGTEIVSMPIPITVSQAP